MQPVNPALIRSLTAVRWWAALAVFFRHLPQYGFVKYPPALEWLIRDIGSTGVSVFFVLSGFVLMINHPPERLEARAFWAARFARIYPAYFLSMIAAIPLEIFSPNKTDQLLALAATTTLTHQFHPLTDGRYNDVGWTLGVEAVFYAAFPLLALLMGRSVRRAALIVAGFAALAVALRAGLGAENFYGSHRFPLPRVVEFAVGMLAGLRFLNRTELRAPGWVPPVMAVALVVVPSCLIEFAPGWVPRFVVTGLLAWALLEALARRERAGLAPWWLTAGWAVVLGEISYAFYLWHNLVIRYTHYGAQKLGVHLSEWSAGGRLCVVVWCFTLGTALAYATWRWWEMPARRWLRAHMGQR